MLATPSKCTICYVKESAIHKDFYPWSRLLPHVALALGKLSQGQYQMQVWGFNSSLQSWALQSLEANMCKVRWALTAILVLIPACSLGKSCASSGEKAARSLATTNYDLYLLSRETLSLLHPIVLLLIFTSSRDNSSQSAWKHSTAPATPCRGSSQPNPTRNKSLFWLCPGQWVS